jgi:AcrR family transcriptional regulator
MPLNENDRRVQRTRQLLQQAMIELVSEKGYDAVTVRDITDRANLGRTTFYAHYESKEDLLLSGHQASVFKTAFDAVTLEAMLAVDVPIEQVTFFEQISEARQMYHVVIQGEGSYMILRGIREQLARNLESKLRRAFKEKDGIIPFSMLCHYIAGAQISMMSWWLEDQSQFSPAQMAQAFHRLRRASLRDALQLT